MAIRVALATRSEDRSEPYRLALAAAGLETVTFEPEAGGSLDAVAGLVLTGGTDVDPALYGAVRGTETEAPDRARDDFEAELLRTALQRDMPVLAICRGLQLFNVVQGGTLIQHLPDTARHKQKTGGTPVHDVVVEGAMAEVFGADRVAVNSRHHQAIEWTGEGMVVTARDPVDGVIEGFVMPGVKFAMGVQWHPEDMVDDGHQRRLFLAFSSQVSASRG
jgi:gamma-glutamyl-gamma-aminobutyrate hydrolase PuuD